MQRPAVGSTAAEREPEELPGLLGPSTLATGARLAERNAEMPKQLPSLVVVLGRRHDRDVHALRMLNLVGIDLREDHLFGQAKAVIAVAVETVGVHAAEVADTRQRDRDQPVKKLIHPTAAEGHLAANIVALAKPETGN